jgi:hypothetical protein
VTLAAPVLASLAGHIPLPNLDASVPAARGVGLLALGLGPIVSTFVLVELAALTWPAWRPLRVSGRAGRARLETASVSLGLLLAVVQAWAVALHLVSIGALPDELPARAVAILTLVAASAALVWVVSLVGRHGLGNGYAILFAAGALTFPFGRSPEVETTVSGIAGGIAGIAGQGETATLLFALQLALFLFVAIAVLGMLLGNEPAPPGRLGTLRLRDPASGLVPLFFATDLLLLLAMLTSWAPALLPVGEALRPGTGLHSGVLLVLAVALGIVFARLFNQPARVAEVWGRLAAAPPEPAAREARARAALRMARLRVVAMLAFVVLLSSSTAAFGPALIVPGSVVGLLYALAAVADVLGEWRARCGAPDLVSVWPEHRLYAVDAGRAALSGAGIPVFARGVHYRALGQFFTPYVPVELLVPASRAAEAEAILGRVLGGESTR